MDAATTEPSTTTPRPARPLRGFALDLLVALATMLLVGVIAGAGWGFLRSLQVAVEAGAAATGLDQSEVLRQIGSPGPLAMVSMVLLSTGSAALAAYYWRRRDDRIVPARGAPAWRRPAVWTWAMVGGVLSFALTQLLGWAGTAAGIDMTPSNTAVFQPAARQSPWLLFAFVVVAAPLYEELLFRRVLFGRLWHAGRPWVGLVLSSLVFAALHELPGPGGNSLATTASLWLVYGSMGAIFAAVYYRTGSLWTAIGAHATNNLLAGAGLLLPG